MKLTNEFLSIAGRFAVGVCGLTDAMLHIRTETGQGVFTKPEFDLISAKLLDATTIEDARAAFATILESCAAKLKAGAA